MNYSGYARERTRATKLPADPLQLVPVAGGDIMYGTVGISV